MSSQMSSDEFSENLSKVGRPPTMSADARREKILDAAEGLFSIRGYEKVSMAEIARATQMSKKTLYTVFDSKEALFDTLVADIEAFPDFQMPTGDVSAHDAIVQLLEQVARYLLSERHILGNRLVIAEGGQSSELSRRFYTHSIGQVKKLFIGQFEERGRSGQLKLVHDAETTTDILFGAVVAAYLVPALTLHHKPNMAEVRKRIQDIVPLILMPDQAG